MPGMLPPVNAQETTRAISLIEPGGIDCDIHPAVPNLKALLPYLSDHWRDIVVQRGVQELEFDRLSSELAADVPSRLAPGQWQARLGPGCAACPGAHPFQHRDRDLQLPLRRAIAVQRGHGRCLRARGERLDGARMAGQGAAPARVDRRADAKSRACGGGDRARRAGPALRADPAAGDARHATGQASLLADIRRRRTTVCRSASTPAPPTAIRSRRSAGRPTTPRITPRRHRRSRQHFPA